MATPTLATVGGSLFGLGYQGTLQGNTDMAEIETRMNENATALDFGDVVCRGVATTPGNIGNCRPMFTGLTVIGISVRALSEANATTGSTVNYPQNKEVPILKDGWILAIAAENVTEGDDCIGVVASLGQVGGTTGGAANGTTRLAFPASAKWQQTVTTGNVGLIHIKCV